MEQTTVDGRGTMIVAMFRTYLKTPLNLNDLTVFLKITRKCPAIVTTTMPGFIAVKMFTAEDREVLALAELDAPLDSPQSLEVSIQNTSWPNSGDASEFLRGVSCSGPRSYSKIREATSQAQRRVDRIQQGSKRREEGRTGALPENFSCRGCCHWFEMHMIA